MMDVQFYKTKTIELYAFEKNTVMIYIYIYFIIVHTDILLKLRRIFS